MAARRQTVVAGKAQSKTRKLLYEEKNPPTKNGHVRLISQSYGDKKPLRFFRPPRPNKPGLANNKKSNKSYRTWEFKVPRAAWSACHVQLTFLSGMPVVSSVDEILRPRRWLSRGTRTNRKIFHCVSISNGEWRVERRAFGGAVGEEALTDRCQRN